MSLRSGSRPKLRGDAVVAQAIRAFTAAINEARELVNQGGGDGPDLDTHLRLAHRQLAAVEQGIASLNPSKHFILIGAASALHQRLEALESDVRNLRKRVK